MSQLTSQNSRGTVLDFLQRDQYYPIYTSLSSCLGIAKIVALTRTCKKLSDLYRELLPIYWDIDRDLSRFVENPYRFRAQLGRRKAFVSGDFAHHFFKGETWKMSELKMDVLVECRYNANTFIMYLLHAESYKIESTDTELMGYSWRYTLNRNDMHGRLLSQIRIIATTKSPAYGLVAERSGSVNVISWNKAYAIFPQFALIDHADHDLNDLTSNAKKDFEEYRNREMHSYFTYGGVKEEYSENGKWYELAYGGVTASTQYGRYYKHTERHIGDRLTWTISFDTGKVNQPKKLDCELQNTHFGMCQVYDEEDYDDKRDEDMMVGSWLEDAYNPKNKRPGIRGVEEQERERRREH